MTAASAERPPRFSDTSAPTTARAEIRQEDDQPFRGIVMGIAVGLVIWLIIAAAIIIAR